MLVFVLSIITPCLRLAVEGSVAPSEFPSYSLASQDHKVMSYKPAAAPQTQEDVPTNRPITQPVVATPLGQDKPQVKPPSTKPVVTSIKIPSIRPSAKPTVTDASSPSKTTSTTLKICQYSGYCNTNSDCQPGNYCRLDQSPWYSQCLADVSSYKTNNCKPNWGTQCAQDSDCCDPGAYCNFNSYRQCQQPAIGSTGCLNPTTSRIPTKSPSSKRSPYCVAKHYDFEQGDDQIVPCPTAFPSINKSIKPTVSIGRPTTYPSNDPTVRLTKKPLNPSINPTSAPREAVITFKTNLNIQLVDCNTLKLCTACHHAIELAQQQVINSTLHRVANVTYINCIVGRRRLSEISRNLAASSNVTLFTTFFSRNPIEDSVAAKVTVVLSVQNGAYTAFIRENSLKLNATGTKNAFVRSLAVGASTFYTLSPTVQSSQISTVPTSSKIPSYAPSDKFSSISSRRPSMDPSDMPSTKPSRSPSITPSDKPSAEPSKIPSIISSRKSSVKTSASPSISRSIVPSTNSPSSISSFSCLVTQSSTIVDSQYQSDTSIICLTVSSTVTSIGIVYTIS